MLAALRLAIMYRDPAYIRMRLWSYGFRFRLWRDEVMLATGLWRLWRD